MEWGWNVTLPVTNGRFSGCKAITRAVRKAGAKRGVSQPPYKALRATTNTLTVVYLTSSTHSPSMTRTERATSPRAILKDRSESKSGMNKRTPKGGAGTHNWGSLSNERDLEDAAMFDQETDEAEGKSCSPLCSVYAR